MKVIHSNQPASAIREGSSDLWADAHTENVSLAPIPIEKQPNRYIREKWKDRSYGSVTSVAASACTTDDELFVRLTWPADNTPNGEFADAAAIVTGSGPAETLGDEATETTLWYWANDRGSAERFVSNGPGVFARSDAEGIQATASLEAGMWHVVLSGPLAEVVDERMGFAVWNGSNDERAGLGAVSGWVTLERG
jgi:DMSO reductase family type II enzyme heme b subunit